MPPRREPTTRTVDARPRPEVFAETSVFEEPSDRGFFCDSIRHLIAGLAVIEVAPQRWKRWAQIQPNSVLAIHPQARVSEFGGEHPSTVLHVRNLRLPRKVC